MLWVYLEFDSCWFILKGIDSEVVNKLLMVKEKMNNIVGDDWSWLLIRIVMYINIFLMMVMIMISIRIFVVKM